jgi:peptidoglycan hydrolase-like protein with peptidoglycan-binding domain
MSLRWVRAGLGTFLLLSMAFTANLLLMQPGPGRQARLTIARAGQAAAVAPARSQSHFAATTQSARSEALESGLSTGSLPPAGQAKPEFSALPPRSGASTTTPDTVRAVQRELALRGYQTGVADGMPGLVTRAAIMAFESDHGLPLTAEPSESLLQRVLLGSAEAARSQSGSRTEPTPEAERVIRTVQQSLASLGYQPGAVDGRLGEQTIRAIREFEVQQGLSETGRVSGQLVARLARLAGQGRIADGGERAARH